MIFLFRTREAEGERKFLAGEFDSVFLVHNKVKLKTLKNDLIKLYCIV